MKDIATNQFIRKNIIDLKPYTPILPFEVLSEQLGRHPSEIIKLDANENPYGASPLVAERLAEAPYLHIYPDPESRELRDALAEYTGLEADYLMVGHGADELIDMVMRLVLEPGDSIINCPPTFGMYPFDAAINAANTINIPRQPDFSLDMVAISQQFEDNPNPPKLIFATSPNNPSGTLLTEKDLRHLLELPTLVILDEAYIEFAGFEHSRFTWVKEHANLMVFRTFSKWAGLAGLRVGYGAFPLEIMTHLWKMKQPYNVNVAGQIAALASLEDKATLFGTVDKLIAERERFFSALQQLDWLTPYPSQTNFILCKVTGRDAPTVKQQLAEAGILVRHYNTPGLSDHIRISIGTPTQMARVVDVMRET
ncbi:histidinol-phosphate transaminase [Anaerolineales bacterium HSG6]|nr:histidinol-phosphate transaminase [Anaerolineales bacterium HSG6]